MAKESKGKAASKEKAKGNRQTTTKAKQASKTKTSATKARFGLSPGWLRRTSWFLVKLTLIVIVVIAAYTVYLDAKVRTKFEGQRWKIPVQVYGYVPIFERGDSISLNKLAKQLKLSGYRKVSQVQTPGEFAQSSKRLIVYRRAFDFGDGLTPASKVTIDASAGRVTRLHQSNSDTGLEQEVSRVRLEPALIDRIVPENKEDRVLLALEVVPERLMDTLLLVEDRDFYFHHGVSPLGIIRALFANIKAGRTVQGGSTLTQQLVKNMFLTREKTLIRKFNEALMALILEYRYSKDQLLEAYINEVYLGQHYANGIYGFGLAAEFYFGKQISELSPAQMATLIGQVKGPSYYDPWRFPERAKKRRDLILGLMFEHHLLSRAEFEQAIYSQLSVRKNRRLRKQNFPDYLQLVKRELAEILPSDMQQTGIKVFTGFDIASQHTLTNTVNKQLASLEKKFKQQDLQAAMLVTDIDSGEIRALVGGKALGYAGFNRALNAKRPVGSLVKPIVYLAALERYEQYNLATPLADKPITLSSEQGQKWQPKNYDGEYRGQVTLLDGLVNSINIPTVNLGMQLGLNRVADAFHLLGYQDNINLQPSMLLGAINMSPLEINQLYLPLAANGLYRQSHAINKVVQANGELLWQFSQPTRYVLSSQATYLTRYAMQEVVKRGTAKSLTWRLATPSVAGKTGTSNEQRDSWFIGFDNEVVVTTWLGKDNNQETPITGSSGALVLFADFMKKHGVSELHDELPDGIQQTWFAVDNGQAYSSECQGSVRYPAISAGVINAKVCQQERVVAKKKSWLERLFGG